MQAILRLDITAIIDAITAQPVLTISVAIIGTSPIARVRLTHTIEARRRATLANRVADLAAVTMVVGGAFHAATVGIADQPVRALVVVSAGNTVIATADGAARTIGAALAA